LIRALWETLRAPQYWPMGPRLALVVLFPLWLVALILVMFLKAFNDILFRPLWRFATSPPRRRVSYYGYGHQSRKGGERNLSLGPAPSAAELRD
jgi:hypothetical protein